MWKGPSTLSIGGLPWQGRALQKAVNEQALLAVLQAVRAISIKISLWAVLD